MCLYHAISVQTDSVKVESVVYRGQRITKFGNGCDAVTQLLLLILTHMHSSLIICGLVQSLINQGF